MKDEILIRGIINGEESAIDQAMKKYSKLLWSIVGPVLNRVASVEDVEECVADVFVYLWRNPEKYDPNRGSLKVWLSVLARSHAIDRYRELSRRSTLPLDDGLLSDQMGLMEAVLDQEEKGVLRAAVSTLEEPDREIIFRRYSYEQRPRDIAQALGLPVKQVENRLYRTKRKLRKQLERKD